MKRTNRITPATKTGRIIVGVLLIIGGFLGFLPILGFWMAPLGLLVLSVDFPSVRRLRRRLDIRIGRWLQRRRAIKKASQDAKRK